MSFGFTTLLIMSGLLSIYFAMSFLSDRPGRVSDIERITISTFVFSLIAVLLAIRSDQFGIDTITYLRIFNQFCFSNINDLESSYQVSFWLIDIAQLGACDSAWLKVAWVLIIVLCFLLLPGRLADRVKIGALGLFSFIGTEIATNAMRQGLSAAVLMLAFAWYSRNRLIGISLAIFSVFLHISSALVVVAVAVSFLSFRYFIAVFGSLIAFVWFYSYFGISIDVIDRLSYEIYKYSLHDASELYIRIMAAAQLAVPIAVMFVTQAWVRDEDEEPAMAQDRAMAVKLALTALPYLTLPYFGYRYIYGIYLIVLYCSRRAILDDRRPAFEMVLIANALIALAWAFGSSLVSQMPFLEFR